MDQILHLIPCAFVISFVCGERVRIRALQTTGAVFRTIESMASVIRRLSQRSYAVIIGTTSQALATTSCNMKDTVDLVSKPKKTWPSGFRLGSSPFSASDPQPSLWAVTRRHQYPCRTSGHLKKHSREGTSGAGRAVDFRETRLAVQVGQQALTTA